MSLQRKLYYINNTSKGWKIMFELYDFIRWTNENGEDTYADYIGFMNLCHDKMLEVGLIPEDIPKTTTEKNFAKKWFYLNGKFKNLNNVKELNFCDSYKINYFRGKFNIRIKNDNVNQ